MDNKTLKYVGGGIIVVVLFAVITNLIVNERLEDHESLVALQQSEQRAVLVGIAETTARNGADAVTESVVKDCAAEERDRFDGLLGSLDAGLSQVELIELERLFGRCGSFYAERKSLMVARMKRELDFYKSYTEQLETLSGKDLQADAQVLEWENLAALESSQDELFSALVSLQNNIINTLLAGKTAESQEIKEILAEVKEVTENLSLASTQAKAVRSELLSL